MFFQSFNICRYGRVQSIKIIPTTLSSGISTAASAKGDGSERGGNSGANSDQISSSLSSQQHFSSNNLSNSTAAACTLSSSGSSAPNVGSNKDNLSEYSSINQFSNSSLNQTTIGVCATIAFMDIKSASKAHTAEHKFDDRVLTTEYYEPTTLTSSINGDNSHKTITSSKSKMGGNCASSGNLMDRESAGPLTPNVNGPSNTINSRLEQIHNSGRYTSSSSHGLVSKKSYPVYLIYFDFSKF